MSLVFRWVGVIAIIVIMAVALYGAWPIVIGVLAMILWSEREVEVELFEWIGFCAAMLLIAIPTEVWWVTVVFG